MSSASIEGPAALIGTTLDRRYRIDTFIGEGENGGFVYRAHDIQHGTPAAVRCPGVPEELSGMAYEEALEAFMKEAEALESASSTSRDVERLLTFGLAEPPGVLKFPFLVFEWLEGKSLEQHIREQVSVPSVTEALAILEPAARGLAALHALGVTHRDVRPRNLWLSVVENLTRMKITQFVLASRLSTTGTSALHEPTDPHYGAPEQFKRSYGGIGPHTDVYCLALCLVELLSGKPALEGNDPVELYLASSDLTRRPTLRARGVHVSDAIEAVFARALAVDPKRRWQNARELWDALVASVPELTPSVPSVSPRHEAALAAAAAVIGSPLVPYPPAAASSTALLPADDARLGESGKVAIFSPRMTAPKKERPIAWIIVAVLAVIAIGIVAVRIMRAAPTTTTKTPAPTPKSATSPSSSSSSSARPLHPVGSGSDDAVRFQPFLTDMIRIPPATFTMGTDKEGRGDGPAHKVRITKAFYIDRNEVTTDVYSACVDDGSCTPNKAVHAGDTIESAWGCNTIKDQPKHPANCVDREQAEKFCTYASKRLPTEAEWEYAARGTDAREYPWGNNPPTTCSMAVLLGLNGECRERKGTGEVGHSVDGRSAFGAVDMAGNVWEWVSDGYEPYPAANTETADPSVPLSPTGKGVLRGGSWDYAPSSAKTTYRLPFQANIGNISTGFRCARDAHD